MTLRLGLLALGLAGCAGPAAPPQPTPDWRGAPVHLRHLGDGGIEVEFVAPTAGHALALREVARAGAQATATFVHRAPDPAVLVAQVVTPLRVAVPAGSLGDAAVVAVRIVDGERDALAILAARPR